MRTLDEIDRQLKARGCHCDVDNEQFLDVERVIDVNELEKLLRGVTLNELASYQDHQHDRRAAG